MAKFRYKSKILTVQRGGSMEKDRRATRPNVATTGFTPFLMMITILGAVADVKRKETTTTGNPYVGRNSKHLLFGI